MAKAGAERRRPEHWLAEATTRDVARLDIPADAAHERRFEISVRLAVTNRGARPDASHALRVQVDGALEWSRAAPTPVDGGDTLELRLARSVPVGRPLRVVATCELRGAQRVALTIVAEEE